MLRRGAQGQALRAAGLTVPGTAEPGLEETRELQVVPHPALPTPSKRSCSAGAADVAKDVKEQGNHQLQTPRDSSFQRSMWPTAPAGARQSRCHGTCVPHVPWH